MLVPLLPQCPGDNVSPEGTTSLVLQPPFILPGLGWAPDPRGRCRPLPSLPRLGRPRSPNAPS